MSARVLAVGVLCIQGAFIEHIRMLQRVAEECFKAEQTKVVIVEVRKPSQLADLDGLIIPGGESTTLSVFLKKNEFEETLKSWMFNEKKPGIVWGTCAGLIMLSDDVAGQKQGGQITLGGIDIQCTRNIYGRQVSSFEGKLKLREPALRHESQTHYHLQEQEPDQFHGIFIRAPGVAKVNSPNVKVLATLADSDNTVVAVQQNNFMATSFHPELTTDTRWHRYFIYFILKNKFPEKESIVDPLTPSGPDLTVVS